ncbi:HNH endonuclease [Paenibacillus sp. V4I5]|uniref:HNH endonuclease n=1 Tax=Paenibacillus sp. V4I5 TaxID=3042306 RepID=UPI0027941D7E|nr:hypothetical protein [Paenibacillus sp. V4I5]MDQ0919157.1 hypothetical protein [Paenibacillus sp. V4I5]
MYRVTENTDFLKPYHGFMCDILKAMRKSFRENVNYTKDELATNLTQINPNVKSFINRGNFLQKIYKLKDCPINLCKEYGKFASRYKSLLNGKWKGKSELLGESHTEFKDIFISFYEELLGYKTFNIALFQTSSSLAEFRAMMSLNKVCPYCDLTKTRKDLVSVDHFLPKAHFPVLSIYPENLIVACKGCNETIKGENIKIPIAHPYYEEISNYITFIIDETDFMKYKVEIKINEGIPKLLKNKITNFIELFKLKERYEENITAELRKFRNDVRKQALAELNGVSHFQHITREDIKVCTEKYFREAIIDNNTFKRAIDGTKIKNDYLNQIVNANDYQGDIEYLESHIHGLSAALKHG